MNFYEILVLIIASALAIRFSFKFDLNQYFKDRRKIKMDQLKNICPHCKIKVLEDGHMEVESYFSSPMGTADWICSRCCCVVDSGERVNRISEFHAKHPNEFLKKEKRFIKQVKRLGLA